LPEPRPENFDICRPDFQTSLPGFHLLFQTAVLFVAGGILLVGGAEALVRGGSRLARSIGISPLVVGLTVVAFGTSAPELAVTVQAAHAGEADVAVGNVVGSNIFNILFVLGLSAAVAPLVVQQQIVRLDVPLVILASVVMFVMALDGQISRANGVVLFAGLVAYLVFLLRQSRRETAAVKAEYEGAFGAVAGQRDRWWINALLVVIGIGLLALGARWLVTAAATTAAALGVSSLVIGLTVVAAGTSLPEVATSVLATIRGERDIAVGNAIGSNLFNILAVLGLGSIFAPGGISVSPGALAFDIPVMIAVAVAALPVLFTGYMIARWEGFVFLAYYVLYVTYLVLHAMQHDALFELRMLAAFVLPLTAITIAVLGVRALRRQRGSAGR
jgi:cation:H+ antiporter